MLSPLEPRSAVSGWQARLSLRYAARADRTCLIRRRHSGPLMVQRPFYPEGPVCHTYLLHPPGGVVGGDRLELEVQCHDQAHALITTPAASKFYRSQAKPACQYQNLSVSRGATLEWLPQESIWFSGAHAQVTTRIELETGAGFIGWESLCLGRPHCGERFTQGAARLTLSLWRNSRPLLIEQLRCDGDSPLLDGAWGMQGRALTATLVAVNAGQDEREKLRALPVAATDSWAVTLIDDVLIGRYIGDSADAMHRVLYTAWQQLRPSLIGRTACAPRIWAT